MVFDSAPANRNATILHPLQHKMLELDVQADKGCMYRTSLCANDRNIRLLTIVTDRRAKNSGEQAPGDLVEQSPSQTHLAQLYKASSSKISRSLSTTTD